MHAELSPPLPAHRGRARLVPGLILLCAFATTCAVATAAPLDPPPAATAPEEPLPVAIGQDTAEPTPPAEPAAPATSSAAPAAATAPTGQELLVATHDYLARDGGTWRAENARYEPGAGGWPRFGNTFSWGLERNVVHYRLSGLREDGGEDPLWEGLAAWDPGVGKLAIHSVGHGGEMAHGEYRVIDETHHQVRIGIFNPDGSSFEIQDDLEILGPDRYRSTTSLVRDGEATKVDEMVWERQKADG